jgi:hypothetical protein
MPGPQASAHAPVLGRLPSTEPAERALAVHFGHFPGDGRPPSAMLRPMISQAPITDALARPRGQARCSPPPGRRAFDPPSRPPPPGAIAGPVASQRPPPGPSFGPGPPVAADRADRRASDWRAQQRPAPRGPAPTLVAEPCQNGRRTSRNQPRATVVAIRGLPPGRSGARSNAEPGLHAGAAGPTVRHPSPAQHPSRSPPNRPVFQQRPNRRRRRFAGRSRPCGKTVAPFGRDRDSRRSAGGSRSNRAPPTGARSVATLSTARRRRRSPRGAAGRAEPGLGAGRDRR